MRNKKFSIKFAYCLKIPYICINKTIENRYINKVNQQKTITFKGNLQ